jgi:hypothetical protein
MVLVTKFNVERDELRSLLIFSLQDEKNKLSKCVADEVVVLAKDPRSCLSLEVQVLFNKWEAEVSPLPRKFKDDIIYAIFGYEWDEQRRQRVKVNSRRPGR